MTALADPVPTPKVAEDIRVLIEGGETSLVEFKSTFKFDLETKRANKALPAVVAKTMCGFLNRSGGVLLIGVADDGRVLGLAGDLGLCRPPDLDKLERAIRTSLANALGVEVTPHVKTGFMQMDGECIAWLACDPHHCPVFVRDGDIDRFYVRDGNQTRPLGVREAHEYIRGRWTEQEALSEERVREIALETLSAKESNNTVALSAKTAHSLVRQTSQDDEDSVDRVAVDSVGAPDVPPWLRVSSRRVLQLFIEPLARSHGWKKLYLISPWISEFETNASMSFQQMLKRMRDDGATAYVVTRPPEEAWHTDAVEKLAATGRANIAYLPNLHTKLYAARTATGAFAMLGSANLTQASLENNLELGVRVNGYAAGIKLVSNLEYEAASIYRTPDRKLVCRATF